MIQLLKRRAYNIENVYIRLIDIIEICKKKIIYFMYKFFNRMNQ